MIDNSQRQFTETHFLLFLLGVTAAYNTAPLFLLLASCFVTLKALFSNSLYNPSLWSPSSLYSGCSALNNILPTYSSQHATRACSLTKLTFPYFFLTHSTCAAPLLYSFLICPILYHSMQT